MDQGYHLAPPQYLFDVPVKLLPLLSGLLCFFLQLHEDPLHDLRALLKFEELSRFDEGKLSELVVVEGGIEFFPHEQFNQEGRASDVHGLYAELILPVKLEVGAGVLYYDWIVAFCLVAGVLLVVDGLPLLILTVDYTYRQPNPALFLTSSQNAKFGFECLLRAGVLYRGIVRRGSIWCGWRESARGGCPGQRKR